MHTFLLVIILLFIIAITCYRYKKRIMFDKIDGFVRDYDRAKYLVLVGLEKYSAFYDEIGYLIVLKSDITNTFFVYLCKNQNWFRYWFTSRRNIDFP